MTEYNILDLAEVNAKALVEEIKALDRANIKLVEEKRKNERHIRVLKRQIEQLEAQKNGTE